MMKISQLFARKTNSSQQPRCCHKRDDGTGCKAHPRTGRQYCFLHDPASQKKSAAARRAGGVIRGYKAQNEAVLKLPPNLPALPLQDTSDVVEMFRETVNHFSQGEMELRSANCIRNFGLAMLRGFEFEMRAQRKAAQAAAPRTPSSKKPRSMARPKFLMQLAERRSISPWRKWLTVSLNISTTSEVSRSGRAGRLGGSLTTDSF